MSDEKAPEIIIVRRRVEAEEGHHGGAWKIAYADFVTAMMAFFLVLWILNSTNKESQTIIARYFNPVKMEDFARNKKGISPQQQKPGAVEGDPDREPPAGEQSRNEERAQEPPKDPAAKAPINDETLFRNPYAALDQIAGRASEPRLGKEGSSSGQAGGLDAFHDPFRAPSRVEEAQDQPQGPPPDQTQGDAQAEQQSSPSAAAQVPSPSQASSPATPETKAAVSDEADKAAALQRELVKAANAEAGANAPRIDVAATDEGLLISLTDKESFGMFAVGASAPNPKLVRLMERIARSLKDQPGAVVLRGYTDARRYKGRASDNWRLSASRAQMALYMLVRGGLPEARIERVEGYADRRLKAPDKPDSAENRRIEILLRKGAP